MVKEVAWPRRRLLRRNNRKLSKRHCSLNQSKMLFPQFRVSRISSVTWPNFTMSTLLQPRTLNSKIIKHKLSITQSPDQAQLPRATELLTQSQPSSKGTLQTFLVLKMSKTWTEVYSRRTQQLFTAWSNQHLERDLSLPLLRNQLQTRSKAARASLFFNNRRSKM